MKNVDLQIQGDKLVITVDLKQEFGLSSSGKSLVVASSEGNVAVKGDIKLGLNVYKPAPKDR